MQSHNLLDAMNKKKFSYMKHKNFISICAGSLSTTILSPQKAFLGYGFMKTMTYDT